VPRPCRRRTRRPPPAPRDHRRPAADALILLQTLGEHYADLAHARFVLAVAFLATCASLEHAQRLLSVVEDVHAARGIDLHHAVRGRTT
jgi:hypothetical protein